MQKVDSLRQDIRKAEKLRREIELRAEEANNEVTKEKKLREKAEAQLKTMESDLASIKSGSLSSSGGHEAGDYIRLKGKLEKPVKLAMIAKYTKSVRSKCFFNKRE